MSSTTEASSICCNQLVTSPPGGRRQQSVLPGTNLLAHYEARFQQCVNSKGTFDGNTALTSAEQALEGAL